MKLTRAARGGHIAVTFRPKSPTLLEERDGVRTLVVGVESEKSPTLRNFRSRIKQAVRLARQHKIEALSFDIDTLADASLLRTMSRAQAIEEIAVNSMLAAYEFSRYKSKKTALEHPKEIALLNLATAEDLAALQRGEMVAIAMNQVRDLANTPGGDMTPDILAKEIVRLAKGSKATVRVLDKKAITKEGMGALLGVARGSIAEPRFIIMEYWGSNKKEQPIVFVGKGITFDTGGLNLKPSEAVLDMHMDMSGGAAVAGAVIAAAKLRIKRNIIGLIPAAENMVSGESFRPGDVLTSMVGKTIDVLNTDAEGRLVLADGLTYAERYQPRLIIDVATLTGAALVALGQHASAIMSKDAELVKKVQQWGEDTGDYVWPLPLWDEYKQYTRGVFGDVANIPTSHARYGGTINGGMFLAHFAPNVPWMHIDMVPRMTAAPGDHLAKGATGEPMRLLLAIAENY